MAPKSIETEALRLLKLSGITRAIDHYRRNRIMATMLSVEQHTAELRRPRDTAIANGKLQPPSGPNICAARPQASITTKVEHGVTNEFDKMSDAELRQYILDQTQALEALGTDLLPAPNANTKLKR